MFLSNFTKLNPAYAYSSQASVNSFVTQTLIHAARCGDMDMASLAYSLNYGANIDAIDATFGRGALHWAAAGGYKDTVELLIREGRANIELRSRSGKTALHYAAESGNDRLVSFFIEKRLDVSATDNMGATALHRAAFHGSERVVRFFIGEYPDIIRTDATLLHWAAAGGNKNVVELLIAEGADISARDAMGSTALSVAAESGHRRAAGVTYSKRG